MKNWNKIWCYEACIENDEGAVEVSSWEMKMVIRKH